MFDDVDDFCELITKYYTGKCYNWEVLSLGHWLWKK